jgi:SAM-dependent methyltransferase
LTGRDRLHCPACGRDVPHFAPGPAGRPNARCPLCQALERHRMLLWLLRRHDLLFMPPARVLDVAPSEAVRRFLQARLGPRYVGTDLFMERVSARADLTRLPFGDASFDAIVCYHVLEHIPADALAIAELARVLKPGGLVFIQVPRRAGAATDEDPSAPVEERIRRFGQDDHVRMYGSDFEDRLVAGGLIPQTLTPADRLPEDEVRRYGLARNEEVWICRSADWSRRAARPAAMPAAAEAPWPRPRPLARRIAGRLRRTVRSAVKRPRTPAR